MARLVGGFVMVIVNLLVVVLLSVQAVLFQIMLGWFVSRRNVVLRHRMSVIGLDVRRIGTVGCRASHGLCCLNVTDPLEHNNYLS